MLQNVIKILRLGPTPYTKALKLQEHLVNKAKTKIANGEPGDNILILLQHHPVYTTGIRTKEYTLEEENYLKSLGADFVRTNRGGLITFHGPGQLVAYPILDLNQFIPQANRRKAALGVRWYVNALEEVIIKACKEFGLKGSRSPHTGVWIGENKVCAMGVHSSQLVTSHGLALNCCVDLNWFTKIVPCGIVGKGVTSLTKELHRHVEIEEAEPFLLQHFAKEFSSRMIDSSVTELNLPADLCLDDRQLVPQ